MQDAKHQYYFLSFFLFLIIQQTFSLGCAFGRHCQVWLLAVSAVVLVRHVADVVWDSADVSAPSVASSVAVYAALLLTRSPRPRLSVPLEVAFF